MRRLADASRSPARSSASPASSRRPRSARTAPTPRPRRRRPRPAPTATTRRDARRTTPAPRRLPTAPTEEAEHDEPTSDWLLIAIEGLLVIGFIALGVRSGGIGLGLWGGVGTLVLVFVFGLDPGEPPFDAMLIIVAVIAAAAAMQAAGGIDYMVLIASRALRARPQSINFVAPFVSYLLCILTGTSNTFYSIIPVINEVSYANKIRPERPLAGSTVASALGITSSPVAAAMATLLPLVEVKGYDLVDVLLITIPASIVGDLRHVARDEQARQGPRRRPRVPAAARGGRGPAAGARGGHPAAALREAQRRDLPRRGARDLHLRALRRLRPTVAAEDGGVEPLSVTPIIQMVMLTAAALILVLVQGQGRPTSRACRSSGPGWSR